MSESPACNHRPCYAARRSYPVDNARKPHRTRLLLWFTTRSLQQGYRFGLQFYDTWMRHLMSNVTIRNVVYSSTEWLTQAALVALTFSDQFKPFHVASIRGIRLVNVTKAAVLSNPVVRTGSWRFYNFLGADTNGGARSISLLVYV